MEEISGSSHHGQAEPAAVPAELKMSAGEIVKLLPSLSPGLSKALLRFLRKRCTNGGVVNLFVEHSEVEKLLERVCKRFAAELEAAVAAVEEGSSGDVILQLSFCLLLALAPSLRNARDIHIDGVSNWHGTYGGEQAVEVLYSALVSQHWSNAVRRLQIWEDQGFGTDRACEHLAHLLESAHCKLQELTMTLTATGVGGMRHIVRALRTNSTLTVLGIFGCEEVGDGGVEQLAAMLRTNSTLEELTLHSIGMTAHGLGPLCDALSTQQSLPAASSSPSGTMGGLKKLDISGNEFRQGGAALLGAMLAHNRCLRSLKAQSCSLVEEDGKGHLAKGMRENSTLKELNISDNQLGKVALGLLVRYLATNTSLKRLHIGTREEMPAADDLVHMITHNQSLVRLVLAEASYDAGEWATVILPALGRNKTLLSINLGGCPGVKGQQVLDALFDLVRINTTIQEIDVRSTPLDDSGEAEAVEVEIRRNNKFRHALSALPRAKPKSCRIVMCGHPYAGKSSLFKTMKLLQPNSQAASKSSLTMSWEWLLGCFLFDLLFSLLLFITGFLSRVSFGYHNLKDKQLSKRTRGIEIHLLKDEEDCRISVWDLAGQREFHALHDFMFPSGDNAATLFVLTFSPIVSPADELRAGEVKTMQELKEELMYWLRFIASNSKPNAASPIVVVVITHKDTLSKLCTHVESWLLCAQDIIADLVAKFSSLIRVEPQPFMVNARASQDAELRRWAEEVESMLRSTLDGLKEEPAMCNQVLRAVEEVSRNRSNSPIISTTEFANICKSKVEQAKAKVANKVDNEGLADSKNSNGESEEEDEKFEMEMESKSVEDDDETPIIDETIGDKIGRAVAAYLHDAGEVIHHDKLDLIVSNPRWFGHGVLGQLIDIFDSSQGQATRHFLLSWCRKQAKRSERPKNGLVSRSYLSHLLKEAVKSVPGLDMTVVTPDQLIQLMLLLDLCYEQTPGDPNTGYLLPAIFDDEGNRAADGKRPLTWRELDMPISTFVGRRLQCGDLERTFLTDGFFPRLQVVLHNHALKEKWIKNTNSGTYIMLEKNLFSIWLNGMEIFIEFSGSTGYFVDILVKSSKSHQQTMEFLRSNIIGTIRTFCASQEGCQGVTLAEAIIRPQCLYGANGRNPILCIHRRDQSILVEELAEKMKLMSDYEHCWDKVENGAGGLVLHDSQDSGTVLRDGFKDVASRPEPNYNRQRVDEVLGRNEVEPIQEVTEDCYPDNNVKEGKQRGLLILISMEGYESGYRLGGSVDRGRLEALAGNLCLEVRGNIFLDFSAADLCEAMKDAARTSVSAEHECVVCFINAHGGTDDGAHFFTDPEGARVSLLNDIVEPFRECKNLSGKPKIFFINSCRGALRLGSAPGSGVEQPLPVQWKEGKEVRYVCQQSDCLLVFSTSEQAVSMRDEEYGTNFVYALMQAFNSKRKTKDVVSIITGVTYDVVDVEQEEEDSSGEVKSYSQCPVLVSSLRKPLYWRSDMVLHHGQQKGSR